MFLNTGSHLPLRTVLELGSGAGLTGLAICKACYPRAYIFSDCHAQVLEQLRGNVLLNGFSLEPHTPIDTGSTKVTVAQLDWDEVTASQLSDFQADVVIAAGNAPSSNTHSSRKKLWVLQAGTSRNPKRHPGLLVMSQPALHSSHCYGSVHEEPAVPRRLKMIRTGARAH